MNIPSLPTSHFSCCCCESTLSLCTPISILLLCYWIEHFQLWLLLISETVIHWIIAHMTLQAYILLVVCLLYKELHHTALGTTLSRVSLWVRVPLETLYERKHPDDKGLSLYWYAIKTRAVAGYQ